MDWYEEDYEIEESIPSEDGGIDGCTLAKMYEEDMMGRESDFNRAHDYSKTCIYKVKKRILEKLYPAAMWLAWQQKNLKQIMWDVQENRERNLKDSLVWVGYSSEHKWEKPYTPQFKEAVGKLIASIRNSKREVYALYRRLEACNGYCKRHNRYIAHNDIFVNMSPQLARYSDKFFDEVANGTFKASMATGTAYRYSF